MGRVPVAAGEYRQVEAAKRTGVTVQEGHHVVTLRHRQTAAGKKIVLDVDDQQGVAGDGCQVLVTCGGHPDCP